MTEIPAPDIDAILQERFDIADEKSDEIIKLIKKNFEDGYDELTIFVGISKAVESAAFVGPSMLNGICGEFAVLAIKLAKAQMEK